MVDVTGIDRKKLLKALWENAKPAAFYDSGLLPPPTFNLDKAMHSVRRDGYVDYVCGRCIKTDLFDERTNVINPDGYDREYGQGAFQRVVASLRKTKDS
jgi:hypothetical protein